MSGSDRLGAWVAGGQTHFRVWAPRATRLDVLVESGLPRTVPLVRDEGGYFTGSTDQARAGDRYRYRIDDGDSWPDPASRFQPDGVHGPSEVIDPSSFAWTDDRWPGPDRDRLVIYELHVGSFTPEGRYAGLSDRLPDLAALGVTCVELLPLNACDGRWNWGYDGAALFAPYQAYGTPDELRSLVDRAHSLGLGVILDVVYNHFGPAGNYTGRFSAGYTRPDIVTAWGPAINLGGPGSEQVRAFFLANARHWIDEYHFDGFRVDATHAFVDDGPEPFLSEFAREVRASTDRDLILIAEDHRNLNTIIQAARAGGWDFDGVWADDFHHITRRYLTGDHDGVFQDFAGTIRELVTTINRGWLKTGEYSTYRRKNRGTDPTGIPPQRFVFCIQNHDRVGNRGAGDRLHHAVDPATYRAISAALLLAPESPLLFMGQEWAASTPWHYFTDHAADLGDAIRTGRAREFQLYDDFRDPAKLATIPDPQAESTFRRGVLDWTERTAPPHAATRNLYRSLLKYRRTDPSFVGRRIRAVELGPDTLGFVFEASDFVAIVHLQGAGELAVPVLSGRDHLGILLSTEDPDHVADPLPITLRSTADGWRVQFVRPGAVILAATVVPATPAGNPSHQGLLP